MNNVEQERRNNAAAAAATTALLKSWMVPPELVAESSSGFVMVIDPSGTVEYVSDTVRCHVGHAGQSMRGQSIYNYVLQADQDKFATALHPQNLISPGNVGQGSSISANSDLNYRRTFGVRYTTKMFQIFFSLRRLFILLLLYTVLKLIKYFRVF